MPEYTFTIDVARQDLSKIPSDTTELFFGSNFNQTIKLGKLPLSLKNWFYLRALIPK